MNTTAALILMFLVCVNIGIFWVHESQVIPTSETSPENPNDMLSKFISVDLSTGNILLGGTLLVISLIISRILTGGLLLGGTVGAGLFALELLSPIVGWILFGIPKLLDAAGVTATAPYITVGVGVIFAVPMSYAILSMVAQRPVKED